MASNAEKVSIWWRHHVLPVKRPRKQTLIKIIKLHESEQLSVECKFNHMTRNDWKPSLNHCRIIVEVFMQENQFEMSRVKGQPLCLGLSVLKLTRGWTLYFVMLSWMQTLSFANCCRKRSSAVLVIIWSIYTIANHHKANMFSSILISMIGRGC